MAGPEDLESEDDAEYDDVEYEESRYEVGEDVATAGSPLRGQRGLRAVPQVGAGLAVCVEDDADGEGFGEVVVAVGFGLAAVVVATGFGEVVVVFTVVLVRVGLGPDVTRTVGSGFAVAVGAGACVVGAAVGPSASGVAPGLTFTWRLERSSPPNVVGMTLSGSAWNPMNASMAVATVASITMTMLDSSEPRCALGRVTAVTSPVVRSGCSYLSLRQEAERTVPA